MFVPRCGTFAGVRDALHRAIAGAQLVDQTRWQGVDVSSDPSARCYEVRNVAFEVPLHGIEDLVHWRNDVQPNLPWADDHFLERVGREPLNPGVQWANWPWASSADKFRSVDAVFNHTYMERLWPKHARQTPGGRMPSAMPPRQGVNGYYGDLDSLVDLLVRDPWTRQAWIPLFFPEDTGWGDGSRKPCTLGYQLLRRGDGLHVWYPLRSCDVAHHWADDCYLCVRLLLWILDECRRKDPDRWTSVRPESYAMHITSLHVFEADWRMLVRKYRPQPEGVI